MILNRLFQYSKPLVPYRSRNAVNVVFTGEVAVEIVEVTAAQAPVAIVQQTEELYQTDRIEPGSYPDRTCEPPAYKYEWDYRPITVEYRWFNGKLWTTVDASDLWHRGDHAPYKLDYPSPQNPDDGRLRYRNEWDGWTHETKEQKIARIKKWALDYLIVDGVVYRTAPEPRYEMNTFGLGCNHGGTRLSVAYSYNSNLNWQQYHRIDDYSTALEQASSTAQRRGDTTSFTVTEDKFTILIPEAITLDPKGWGCPGDEFSPKGKLGKLTELRDPTAAGLLMLAGVFGGR